ncbi:MAG: transcription regulator protein, partial [uncultured bacterium]
THVLRYWESEFPSFSPRKSRTGQRSYTKKDIDTVNIIKKLLYEDKFTIKGAKTKLKELQTKDSQKVKPHTARNVFSESNQLVFDKIEQEVHIQLPENDFLVTVKGKLTELLKIMREND